METPSRTRPVPGIDVGKRSHWARLVTAEEEIALNAPVANGERDLDDLPSERRATPSWWWTRSATSGHSRSRGLRAAAERALWGCWRRGYWRPPPNARGSTRGYPLCPSRTRPTATCRRCRGSVRGPPPSWSSAST